MRKEEVKGAIGNASGSERGKKMKEGGKRDPFEHSLTKEKLMS